jgi:putative spermidine/putrescine transport system ATP-binding protein
MSDVRLEGVSKSWGSVRGLDSVSLDVASGELVALLGPSGCGKTTLLRSVAGLEQPDRGRVVIGGADMTGVPTRERPIGMVFQSYALFPNLTVRQNIAFPLEVRGQPAAEVRRRVDELLELVALTGQADRYPNRISGGQAQRAALGRALAPDPEVLLLDEPLSALDAIVRTRLRDEIRRIQKLIGTTAIYVTHDQSEAMAIADRVAVMNHGRIEQLATPPELYEAPATTFSATFVGSRNGLELPVADGRIRLGRAFEVPAPPGSNGRAVVFFRPEDVQVVDAAAGQPAEIEIAVFLGATTRLHLVTRTEIGETRLYADVPSRSAGSFLTGSMFGIRVAPELVRAFAAEP